MLQLAGIINIIIAIGHIVGLIWAQEMFEYTGVGQDMANVSGIHPAWPYIITVLVAIVFFIFGLYGLSGAGKISKLPFLRSALFVIAGIYLFRGIAVILFMYIYELSTDKDIMFSLVATVIGLLYLAGALNEVKENTDTVNS